MTYGITVVSKDGQHEVTSYGDVPDGSHEISGHDEPAVQVTGGSTYQGRHVAVTRRDEVGRHLIGAQHSDQVT
ncbi:MAG: hypothetical protein ACRDOL_22575 [Streptosporangiaceae bacterium]